MKSRKKDIIPKQSPQIGEKEMEIEKLRNDLKQIKKYGLKYNEIANELNIDTKELYRFNYSGHISFNSYKKLVDFVNNFNDMVKRSNE